MIKLKIARIEKGLKQKEVAEKAGITYEYLSALENGRMKNPSKKIMDKISIVLGKSVNELFY